MRWLATALACLVLGGFGQGGIAQPAKPPQLERAAALVRAGKAEEAWQLLIPYERQYAGQPEFDYQLGIAALESGRESRATFILERVLAVNPGHAAARLEMGRAYFALRDYERAEREFNAVLGTDPPPAVRKLVADYMERMQRRTLKPAASLSGYAQLSVGRDTNVNAASSQGSAFLPVLGTELVPDPSSRRQADNFLAFGGGAEISKPLGNGLTVVAGGDVRQRTYDELHAFDSRVLDLHLGLYKDLGDRDTVRVTLGGNDYRLDGGRYRRIQSASSEWARMLGRRARVALFAQGHRIRYLQDTARLNSSDFLVIGVNGAYTLEEAARTTVFAELYAGVDKATEGRPDGDRGLRGVSGSVQRALLHQLDAYISISLLDSDYRSENPMLAATRHDRLLDVTAGLSWQFAEGWFLRPQVLLTRNRSNLPLDEYRREEAALTLRRVWQ